eukprot:gnl/MRDRNA2_/MRDRNA2_110280_c0_seq1.p1 gnl/MRDRNA2_/MRDRNA2_110280_c0~~gnl/MRDRNA2_/MRDRNA2_110280_c0_seq1.p1  ORF type:complete len:275 (+),score=94.69 gnl/MRDRNA2_/MRDRNA2_110280_c0_seq1:108-932(+)
MTDWDPEKDDSIQEEVIDRSSVIKNTEAAAPGKRKRRKIDHALLFDDEMGFKKLLKDFSKVKFRGKGNERQDLKLMMGNYRQWFQELLIQDVDLEECANKTRNVLLVKEPHGREGAVSDPKERLTEFRCEYKNPAAAGEATASGAQRKALEATPASSTLNEEQLKRIAENRQKALERKKLKDGAVAGDMQPTSEAVASGPASQPVEVDMEVQWRIEQNRLKALEKKKQKELEAAGAQVPVSAPTQAHSALDDPFGMDDDFYPEDDFGFDGGLDE